MPPCQPLGEEEEGHCDEQVESPICRRRNTGMEAKLGKGAQKRKIMVLIPNMVGVKDHIFCLYSSLKTRIL